MKGINLLIVAIGIIAIGGFCFTPAVAQEALDETGVSTLDVELAVDAEIVDQAVAGDGAFGRNGQATWLAAPEFDEMDSGMTWNRGPFGVGSFRCKTAGATNWFDAQVRLPSGARLLTVRMYYDDNSAANRIYFFLFRTGVTSEGSAGVPFVVTQLTPTYGVVSDVGVDRWDNDWENTNITIANRYNIYTGRVNIGNGTCLVGVRLFWQRQIRTGLSHPFVDIGFLPAEFQNSIAALYRSGITTGTTATTYSPSANLTRAQMAVFLARALGLHWAYSSNY